MRRFVYLVDNTGPVAFFVPLGAARKEWVFMRQKGQRRESIDRNEICELYRKGFSISMIAHKFGVSRQYIWQAVRSAGLNPDCQENPVTESELRMEKVIQDFLNGATLEELSKKHRYSISYLRAKLKMLPATKKEYELRKQVHLHNRTLNRYDMDAKRLRDAQIFTEFNNGKSVAQLSKDFNTCISNIYRIIRVGRKNQNFT